HLTAEGAEYTEETTSRVKGKTMLPLKVNTFSRRGRGEKEQTEWKQKTLFKTSHRFESLREDGGYEFLVGIG
ncbi:hypothetical protein KAV67_01845, partial [Candidatus Bipolaricaulota bacterium]|nr:hypothetical protein [Candidatus Bipolaricaulota bacterium]